MQIQLDFEERVHEVSILAQIILAEVAPQVKGRVRIILAKAAGGLEP